MSYNYVTIIDNTGRNILGVLDSESDSTLSLVNPVMISVQPTQSSQFQVQLIPLFLAEFIASGPKGRNFIFTYSKSNVAIGKGFELDPRITNQYNRIIEAANAVKPTEKSDAKPEVIKLFEE